MEIESLVDAIMGRVYHGATLHDDPYVQERIVRSDIWDLIQDYEDAQLQKMEVA